MLLHTSERADYGTLVSALRCRFGQCFGSELLWSELHSCQRIPGEQLQALANNIESLASRAYVHIPPSVQIELPCDQFIRALSPAEPIMNKRPNDLGVGGTAMLSFGNGQVVKMRLPGARHTEGLAVGSWTCHTDDGDDSSCKMPPSASQQEPLLLRTWPGSVPGREGEIMGALQEIMQKSSGNLDKQQQELLWDLIVEFQDRFACDEGDFGQLSLVQHDITQGMQHPYVSNQDIWP